MGGIGPTEGAIGTTSIGRQYNYNSDFYSAVNFVSSSSEDYITFKTHSSGLSVAERMRITGLGYVGIGTTSPSVKLDVNGDINANDANFNNIDAYSIDLNNPGNSWGDSVTIGFITDNKQRRGEIGYWTGQGNTSTSDNEGLRFTAKGNFATRTDMSILDVNGNVGIGTINPIRKLHIMGSITTQIDSNTDNFIELKSNSKKCLCIK